MFEILSDDEIRKIRLDGYWNGFDKEKVETIEQLDFNRMKFIDEALKHSHQRVATAQRDKDIRDVVEDLNKEAYLQHTHNTYDVAERVLRQKAREYSAKLGGEGC